VGSDAGRRPGDRGQEDHLQAVADAVRQVGAAQRLELAASGFVELYKDHTSLYGRPLVKTNLGQVLISRNPGE
jgi:hypothetical protein